MKELNGLVYKHTTPNGKVYVGITTMENPNDRWKNGLGYINNTEFFEAISKYGWDNIDTEILYRNIPVSEAQLIEQDLIKELKANDAKYGYNKTSGGEVGKRHSLETRLKISKALQGVNGGEKHRCYGMNPKDIFGIEGYRKSVESARKRFLSDQNPQKLNPRRGHENHMFGKKVPKETITKMVETKADRGIVKLDFNKATEIRKMYSEEKMTQQEIADKYGVKRGTIHDIIYNKIWIEENYIFEKDKVSEIKELARISKISKPIARIDENGNIIKKYESVKEAARKEGMTPGGITKHLKHRVKKPRYIYI